MDRTAAETTISTGGGDVGEATASPWPLVLGSALALSVSNGPVILYAFAVFLKPLSADLGIDRATVSLAPAIGLALYSAVITLTGGLFDQLGLRRVVLTSVTVTALLFACLGLFAGGPISLLAFYAAITVAATGYSPVPFAKVVAASFERNRGLALGLAMSGVGIGTALVPMACQALIGHFGWRIAYGALGMMVFVLAFPAVFLTLPDQIADTARDVSRLAGRSKGEAVRSGVFWQAGAAFFILAIATSGIFAHLVALLTDRGIPALVASSAIGIGGLALIFGRVLSGILVDHVHARYVTSAFFASAAAGAALLAFPLAPWTGWLAIALVGLALGAEVDLIAYVVSRYLGLREFGSIYGYLFAIFTSGTALGPIFMGTMFAVTHSYSPALLTLVTALALGFALTLGLGSYRFGPGAPAADAQEGARL